VGVRERTLRRFTATVVYIMTVKSSNGLDTHRFGSTNSPNCRAADHHEYFTQRHYTDSRPIVSVLSP